MARSHSAHHLKMKPGLHTKSNGDWDDVVQSIIATAKTEVLVGFPSDGEERQDDDPMTNAALGYIHDNGAPEAGIPARPFMAPGIADIQDEITRRMRKMARDALDSGDLGKVEAGFHALGLRAKLSIQNKINDGIPPPLADSTLRARARRGRKGAQDELDARRKGEAPSMASAKPLVDTGQMRNAVNYAIRLKTARSS